MPNADTGRATEEQLNELHRRLTAYMLKRLDEAEAGDKPIRASTLHEMAKFLRDNSVRGAAKEKPANLDVPFHDPHNED